MDFRRVDFILVLIFIVLLFSPIIRHQMEDSSISARKLIVSALTPTTYNAWISEVKGIAVRSRVWEYVDPDGSEMEPEAPKYPRFSDYTKAVPAPIHTSGSTLDKNQNQSQSSLGTILGAPPPPIFLPEPCSDYEDLSESQKRAYDSKERAYRHIQSEVRRAMIEIEKVHIVILESAKDYVAMNLRSRSVREILQSLARKFKKIPEDNQRQIDRRYDKLRNSYLVKREIES